MTEESNSAFKATFEKLQTDLVSIAMTTMKEAHAQACKDVAGLVAKIQALQEANTDLANACDRHEQTEKRLTAEIHEYNLSYSELDFENKSNIETCSNLKKTINELEQTIHDNDMQIKSLNTTIDTNKSEIGSLNEQIKQLTTYISTLMKEAETKQQQLNELTLQNEQNSKLISDLKTTIEEHLNTINVVRLMNTTLTNDKTRLTERIEKLENELTQTKQELMESRSEVENKSTALATSESINQSLMNRLGQMSVDGDKSNAAVAKYKTEIEQVKNEYESLTALNKKLNEDYSSAQGKISELNKTNFENSKKMTDLVETNKVLESKINNVTALMSATKNDFNAMLAQKNLLSQENKTLNEEKQKVISDATDSASGKTFRQLYEELLVAQKPLTSSTITILDRLTLSDEHWKSLQTALQQRKNVPLVMGVNQYTGYSDMTVSLRGSEERIGRIQYNAEDKLLELVKF
jgi:chromosome segregation ATPase